jgi:aarF domain-containing kinase
MVGAAEAWAGGISLGVGAAVGIPALLVAAPPGRHRVLRSLGRGLALSGCVAAGGVGAAAFYSRNARANYAALLEDGLPLTYDPSAIASFWSQHPDIALHRIGVICKQVLPFAAGVAWDQLTVGEDEREARQAARARGLRELLTELGPTFIKFGQMLSIRPDVMPQPVITELQKLCDAVPSYPTARALELIELELGAPASELFLDLDAGTPPIAAASLGQVYRCRLRSTGERVALKVQRPDMLRAVSLDLYLLRKYMVAVEFFKEEILTGVFGAADRSAFDVRLLDTFANASYRELDYVHEGTNQDRMAAALQGSAVYVPKVHWAVTKRKVIATQWIDGIQLAKSPPPVIRKLVPAGVDCFLAQLLKHGFFHSDPHPGNMLVDTDGRLVLIDFGLCAEVDRMDSTAMTKALVDLMRGDVPGLLDDAIALRFLPQDVDRKALLPVLERIFAKGALAADAIAREEEGLRAAGKSRSMATRRAQFGEVSKDLNSIFYEFPFAVPEYFALITRALIVLEGIALTGDRDFDIFRASYPYAAKHAAQLFGVRELGSMLQTAAETQGSDALAKMIAGL